MAATISYPCDPVVNGAAEIQATVFAFVAADYSKIDQQAAYGVLKRAKNPAKYFPTQPNPSWSFGKRKDVAGQNGVQIIGIQVLEATVGREYYSQTAQLDTVQNVQLYEVFVHSWHPNLITKTDASVINVGLHKVVGDMVVINPESGEKLTGDGAFKHLLECVGVLYGMTAASYPTTTPIGSVYGFTMPWSG